MYEEGVVFILGLGISMMDVDMLSSFLEEEEVCVYICNISKMRSFKFLYNVIGEIKGFIYLDEIIFVGGYLDLWDVGEGVYDDGVGCV